MSETEYFPGFFDSDGRPWDRLASGKLPRYQDTLESALKVAALTQHSIHLPLGYYLDNPGLQRLFLKYSDGATESKAFRAVMKELLRVAIDEALETDLKSSENWKLTRHYWITGEITGRNEFVYLNSVDDENARRLLKSPSGERLEADWNKIMLASGIDPDRLFEIWAQLGFGITPYKEFAFSDELSGRLLNGKERYSEINDELFDKLKAVEEKAKEAKQRVSRSLLRNVDKCRELGISEDKIITAQEYYHLVYPLQHYHHLAFAKTLGIGAICTPKVPLVEERVQAVLSEESKRLFDKIEHKTNLPSIRLPLHLITFDDIYKIRCGMTGARFRDSLNQLHDATRTGTHEEYIVAFNKHARLMRTAVSWDFQDVKPQDFAKSLDESVFTEEPTSAGIFGALKFAFTVAKDLVPNLRKDLQLRRFFRKVRDTKPNEPGEENPAPGNA